MKKYISKSFLLIIVITFSSAIEAQTVYEENFDDGLAQDWVTVGGSWLVQEKQYRHNFTDGIHLAVYSKSNFKNYTYTAEIKPDWENNYGVIFNYKDSRNYYKIELDANPLNAWFYEIKDSIETKIGETTYSNGGQGVVSTIKVVNNGTTTTVEVNGKVVFNNITTSNFASGKIGLYAWWQPIWFDNIKVVGELTTGMNSLPNQSAGLKVYPNPVNGEVITIAFPEEAKDAKLEVFNNDGKLVFNRETITSNPFQLDASFLKSSGVYFVHVTTKEHSYRSKIVKN